MVTTQVESVRAALLQNTSPPIQRPARTFPRMGKQVLQGLVQEPEVCGARLAYVGRVEHDGVLEG